MLWEKAAIDWIADCFLSIEQISGRLEKERIINKAQLLTFHYWLSVFSFVHVPLVNRCLRRAVVLGTMVVLPWWRCPKTVLYKSVNYLVLIGKWFQ